MTQNQKEDGYASPRSPGSPGQYDMAPLEPQGPRQPVFAAAERSPDQPYAVPRALQRSSASGFAHHDPSQASEEELLNYERDFGDVDSDDDDDDDYDDYCINEFRMSDGNSGSLEHDRDEAVPNGDFYRNLTMTQPTMETQPNGLRELHPFVQLLTLADLDACCKVEEAFPPHERCSREKLRYRLTRCPELSLGVFSMPPKSEWEDGKPDRATLVAHIIASRTSTDVVTDASMSYPPNWEQRTSLPAPQEQPVGHVEDGQTVAVHSLAVLEGHQGRKLGTTLMKAYIQRIRDAHIAKRIALIAHEHLIPFYERFGFVNKGKSACQFGGGGWYDMVLEFGDNANSDDDDEFP
ncbi:hypothetical protein KEM55_007033 [Ascosphaera atra]|nr:hypothetical protein KEM55_007033 [Ascosphaera atra]